MVTKKVRCPKLEHLTREEVEGFYAQAFRRLEVASLEAHINLTLGATNCDYAEILRENEELTKALQEDMVRTLAHNGGES